MTDSLKEESKNIVSSLKNPALHLQEVLSENNNLYIKELKPLILSIEWEERSLENCQYWLKKLQNIIDSANNQATKLNKRE